MPESQSGPFGPKPLFGHFAFASTLLDLYLDKGISKETLIERETRLKTTLTDLDKERSDLSEHLHTNILTDKEINSFVTYCEEIGVGLDNATFEDKRRYFDWLQVRGKLAVED